jgi:hypothetical protein
MLEEFSKKPDHRRPRDWQKCGTFKEPHFDVWAPIGECGYSGELPRDGMLLGAIARYLQGDGENRDVFYFRRFWADCERARERPA